VWEYDDYNAPQFLETSPEIEGNIISLASLAGVLAQNDSLFTFEATNNFAEAYVVSTDESGNFFRELIVQDKPEAPTYGIAVQADLSPLFTKYNFGRKVYIKLDGLTLGQSEGSEPRLGVVDGSTIGRIPESLVEEHIIRDTITAQVVATQKQDIRTSFYRMRTRMLSLRMFNFQVFIS